MTNIYIILAMVPTIFGSSALPPVDPDTHAGDDMSGTQQTTTEDGSVSAALTSDGLPDTFDLRSIPAEPAEPAEAKCTEAEKLVWRDNVEFSLTLSTIAHSHLGSGPATVRDMMKTYPTLTEVCASCFGETVTCGARQCWMSCMFDSFSAACLDCTDRECNPALKTCLGVDEAGMPPRPTGAQIPTTSTTTFVPRRRVRRVDSTTLAPAATESFSEVIQLGNDSAVPSSFQTSISRSLLDTIPTNLARYWYLYASGLVGLFAIIISRLSGSTSSPH